MIISFAVMQAQVTDGWMPIPDYPVEDGCITLSYDSSNIRLYFDGKLLLRAHSGYLSWGDGGDHNLYLNRYATAGWEAKGFMMT